LAIEISPELFPAAAGWKIQSTEEVIRSYQLQNFNLLHVTHFGFRPSRMAYLAFKAWSDVTRGSWPESIFGAERLSYSLDEIKHWLEIFLFRFFTSSRFKRSALPNGPKISSGGSLSPRGDWRALSGGNARVWLEELRANVP
jgi:NAD+ synthase (glutamine-hydrolysing)